MHAVTCFRLASMEACLSDMCCTVAASGVFFFKQKTAYEMRISDWSSDVCSTDLAGRAAQRRNLLQPCRGQGADRGMAAPLQHGPTAQQPRLPPAGTGSGNTAIAGLRFRFAPPPAGNGGGDVNALTIKIGRAHV